MVLAVIVGIGMTFFSQFINALPGQHRACPTPWRWHWPRWLCLVSAFLGLALLPALSPVRHSLAPVP